MSKFAAGSEAYIIENGYRVTKVIIKGYSGGFYTVQVHGSNGAIRLKEHRIYKTEDEAYTDVRDEYKVKKNEFWMH